MKLNGSLVSGSTLVDEEAKPFELVGIGGLGRGRLARPSETFTFLLVSQRPMKGLQFSSSLFDIFLILQPFWPFSAISKTLDTQSRAVCAIWFSLVTSLSKSILPPDGVACLFTYTTAMAACT